MTGNGILMLRVMDILRKHTDEEHRLQQKEIARLYAQIYGETIGTKTLRHILRDLAEEDTGVGCDERQATKTDASGRRYDEVSLSGFYVEHSFTDEELRLLIDSVVSSPYLTAPFRKEMTTKLQALASGHFEARSVLSRERRIQENPEFLLSVKLLDEAISRGRKVRFRYLTPGDEGCFAQRENADGGPRDCVVSPYRLTVDSGRYYAICNDDRFAALSHYRVDRMSEVALLENEAATPLSKLASPTEGLNEDLRAYCESHAYMLSGEPEYALLFCDRGAAPALADVFGGQATVSRSGSGFRAKVFAVPESVLRFARVMAPMVRIVEPRTLRERARREFMEAAELHAERTEAGRAQGAVEAREP